ncbi:guanine nucleotide exchange factor MSS4 homolog isoform X4 [Diachasmimorpha longicaudata]|uniref:guanine nucleotide exchange factor MSS4 homolog isoform X4 n=1 Tax=Diachasmimorpha longicaudata TaxID=58733 RepID=UPI0030B8AE3D
MMSSMAKFSHEDKYDENGRNKSRICCQFCSSVILSSSAGTFLTHEFDLPHMRSKRDEGEEEKVEKLKDYWLVEDMYTFENRKRKRLANKEVLIPELDCNSSCQRGNGKILSRKSQRYSRGSEN